MNIYVAHSRGFDYQNELYLPIRNSDLNNTYNFILPHESSDMPYSSVEFFRDTVDLVIAEVSFPATGLGIELGWENVVGTPIVCFSQEGKKISGSLKTVSHDFVEYTSPDDFIEKLGEKLNDIF